jgi:hypothetical protein
MFWVTKKFQGAGQLPDTKLLPFDLRNSSERCGVRDISPPKHPTY